MARLILILVLFSLSPPMHVQAQYLMDYEIKYGAVLIPYQDSTYLIFDSGAPTMLDSSHLVQQGHHSFTEVRMNDASGDIKNFGMVRLDKLVIQGHTIKNVQVLAADFQSNPFFKCINVVGIIGFQVISSFNWRFDFKKHELELGKKPFPIRGRYAYTITMYDETPGRMMIPMTIEGDTMVVEFDTGNTGYLDLNEKMRGKLIKTSIGASSIGIHGNIMADSTISQIYMADMQIGDMHIENGNYTWSPESEYSLLGMGFLSQLDKVIINSTERELGLISKRKSIPYRQKVMSWMETAERKAIIRVPESRAGDLDRMPSEFDMCKTFEENAKLTVTDTLHINGKIFLPEEIFYTNEWKIRR